MKKQDRMPDNGMNGLYKFLSDIRNCKTKDDEIKRINKELANIRSKFSGNKVLKSFKKKKYICKLIFIFLLGHNFDFGHIEAVNLMNSGRYSEKYIGYLFASILLNRNSNIMPMILKVLENDLMSCIPEDQSLALKCIANLANKNMAEALGEQILSLLFRSDIIDDVKQSALLSLLAIYKIKRDVIAEKEYSHRLLNFLSDNNVGIVTAAVCLVEEMAKEKIIHIQTYISVVIGRLNRLLRSPCLDISEYHFYFLVAPWQCVRFMRLLRYCSPPSEPVLRSCLSECMDSIFHKVQEPPHSKRMEHRVAKYALLVEAVHLIDHMDMGTDARRKACSILDACLKQKEPNLRFLALECLEILCRCETTKERVEEKQIGTILGALNNETDPSVREKAADLLGVLCNANNYEEIISEMLMYLDTSTMKEKEKIILKIYLLMERCHSDLKSYVDTVMDLVYVGGEFIKKEIWYRYVQFVINSPSVQGYAAKRAFEVLQSSQWNENVVILAACVLGEFGNLIAGDERSSPITQLNLLQSRFLFSSWQTRALLLTTYVKFANLFPEIKDDVKDIFRSNSNNSNAELQQRAVEYLNLLEVGTSDCLATVLEEMPPFGKRSVIENALNKLNDKSIGSLQNSQFVDVETQPIVSCFNTLIDEFKPDTPTRILTLVPSGSPYRSLIEEYERDTPIRSMTLVPGSFNSLLEKTEQDTPIRSSTFVPGSTNESNVDILAKAFCDANVFDPIPIQRSMSTTFEPSRNEALINQIWHKKGTLYESAILKIQFQSHFARQEGQIRFKYMNKTNCTLSSFLAHLPFENCARKWNFVVNSCPTTINPKSEVEQHIGVECLQPFTSMPSLSLSFVSTGSHLVVPIQIPMTLNKFIEPSTISLDEFKKRWNSDLLRQNHVTKTVSAKYLFDESMLDRKLTGFGLAVLCNIDPNPENFVCSGVFHSRSTVTAILLILRPQCQDFTYNLSVRSMDKEVSDEVLRLVELII